MQLIKVHQFLVPCAFSDCPSDRQCPVTMADVRDKTVTLSLLELGEREGRLGVEDGGKEEMTRAGRKKTWQKDRTV